MSEVGITLFAMAIAVGAHAQVPALNIPQKPDSLLAGTFFGTARSAERRRFPGAVSELIGRVAACRVMAEVSELGNQ